MLIRDNLLSYFPILTFGSFLAVTNSTNRTISVKIIIRFFYFLAILLGAVLYLLLHLPACTSERLSQIKVTLARK